MPTTSTADSKTSGFDFLNTVPYYFCQVSLYQSWLGWPETDSLSFFIYHCRVNYYGIVSSFLKYALLFPRWTHISCRAHLMVGPLGPWSLCKGMYRSSAASRWCRRPHRSTLYSRWPRSSTFFLWRFGFIVQRDPAVSTLVEASVAIQFRFAFWIFRFFNSRHL